MKHLLIALFLVTFSTSVLAQDSCQCCSSRHQAFDFWIGSWTVTNPKGEVVGYNKIDKKQDNCMVHEVYTDAKGKYVGASNNFYNEHTGQWEQTWVYESGKALFFKGNKEGNQMILSSRTRKNAAGIIETRYYHLDRQC